MRRRDTLAISPSHSIENGSAVATVSVTASDSSIVAGSTVQATVVARDAANNILPLTGRTVVWTSSATAVATVSTSGLVSAVGAGTSVIGVSVDGVGPATFNLVVAPVPVASVSVTAPDSSVNAGSVIQATVVARDAANVEVTEYRTIDGQRAATLTFTSTEAARLGKANVGAATLEHIADYATFLLCAEAVGVLDALNHATVEYTKERKQFGTPIARFQALQHRMVEMLIHAEQARSITYLAAARYTSDDADERRRAISAAKARVGQAARFVGQQAVQLHGGMGVTNEVAAAHWFKRLSIIETTLGDVDHPLARFASFPGFAKTDV